MIRHVVFFKFKPEASDAERKAALDGLRALPNKIDVICEYEVGEDVMHATRSWDAVLVSVFEDLQELETYSRHDDHLEVVLKLKPICDAIGSVDYEF